MTDQTRAIVRIGHGLRSDAGSEAAAHFKRLALFFDKILFVLPDYWIIKDEVAVDPNKTARKPGGGYDLRNIDPFTDTIAGALVPINGLGDELKSTLSCLAEHGIAEEVHPTKIALETDLHEFDTVRSQFGRLDVADARFIELSGSPDTEFEAETATAITGSGKERLLQSVVPPKAVRDSSDITSILFAAEHTSSSPVFLDPAHRAELAYRYEQYKRGLAIINDHRATRLAGDEFLDQFGAVTFHLGNALVDETKIATLSAEDVVQLRESMENERHLLVSEHLVEATTLVKDNPWSPALRADLERIAKGRLATDLIKFRQTADARAERFRARATERLTAAGALAAIGATAGLTASVVPGVTPWLLATIGAIGAAANPLLDI